MSEASINGTGRLRIGPYTVERTIGRGAMGTVYAARRDGDPTLVALKTLHFDNLDESVEAATERFDHEVKATNSLHHPSIIRVFESGSAVLEGGSSVLYYSMEVVPGETLHTALKRGPFFASEAAAIIARVADALNFTHAHGIVHRDVKPGNVFLTPEGRVVLVDFGICKFSGQAPLTSAGGVMGTLPFMAPEQLYDQAVDHRTDIFALGSLLFTLLTRRYLRPSNSVVAVVRAVQEGQDLIKVRSVEGVDPALIEVMATALQPDPALRYQRVRDLINALSPMAGELPPIGAAREIPSTFTGKRYEVDSDAGIDEAAGADFMGNDEAAAEDGLRDGDPPSSGKHRTKDFRTKWFSKKRSGDLASYMERLSQQRVVREVAEPILVKAPTVGETEWSADVDITSRQEVTGAAHWLRSPLVLSLIALMVIGALAGGIWTTLRRGALELAVASRPAGAEVLLDGVLAGRTPLQLVVRGRGQVHQLEIRAELRRPWLQELEVPLLGTLPEIHVDLGWHPAAIHIASQPSGALVVVDGSAACKTPCAYSEIQPRRPHLVSVLGDGCRPEQFAVELEPAAAFSRELALQPLSPRDIALVQVIVDRDPVRIDGLEMDAPSGSVDVLLYPGLHHVELPRVSDQRQAIELKPGQVLRLDQRAHRSLPRPGTRLVKPRPHAPPPQIKSEDLRKAVDHALYLLASGRRKPGLEELSMVLANAPLDPGARRLAIVEAAAQEDAVELRQNLDSYLSLSNPPVDVGVAQAVRTALEPGPRCR
ncbi:MAG: serine/threonine-protein kinase [Pseudomonadota bacterium]